MRKLDVVYCDKKLSLNVLEATEGASCVDISPIEKELGLYTFDPAFVYTASCESKITFIDGDAGILAHRGILIQDIIGNMTFLELFFFLFTGKRKEEDINEFEPFKKIAIDNLKIDDSTKKIIESFNKTDHPMGILMAAFSNIAARNSSTWNVNDLPSIKKNLIKLVGEFLACVIVIYRFIKGKSLEIKMTPHFTETICLNMFDEDYFRSHKKEVEDVFNRLFVLHADHEQNASTSTVRMVASTDVNPYASVVAGVAALWGPLHGGANEAVIKMLDSINSVADVPLYLQKVKNKEIKLMGFGHRVYKNYDPRAVIIKQKCDEIIALFSHVGDKEKLVIAQELERQATADDYFTSRKLFPNVDFYSGIIYKSLEIPSQFFTVMFAAARVAGWCSQMYEFYSSEHRKISRPRQLYVGNKIKQN